MSIISFSVGCVRNTLVTVQFTSVLFKPLKVNPMAMACNSTLIWGTWRM